METNASTTEVPVIGCQGFTCIIELSIAIGVTYCILLSNLLNLIVLGSTPSLRNCHGYLLISLSVADFGTGVFSAFSIYPLAKGSSTWPYGDILCLMTAYLLDTCRDTSAIMLTMLSIERYIAVLHPLRYSRIVTKHRALWASILSWLVSLSTLSAVFFQDFVGYGYQEQLHTCQLKYITNSTYTYSLLVCVALPCIVIIIVTSILVKRSLIKQRKRRAELTHVSSRGQSGSSAPHIASETGHTMKLFKMVRIMCLVFMACWVPFVVQIFYILGTGKNPAQFLMFCTFWLVTLNSFFNAVIYFSRNKTFMTRAKELSKLILPKFCIRVNTWHRHVDDVCSRVCCFHGDFDLRKELSAESSEIPLYIIDCELVTFSKQSLQLSVDRSDEQSYNVSTL